MKERNGKSGMETDPEGEKERGKGLAPPAGYCRRDRRTAAREDAAIEAAPFIPARSRFCHPSPHSVAGDLGAAARCAILVAATASMSSNGAAIATMSRGQRGSVAATESREGHVHETGERAAGRGRPCLPSRVSLHKDRC
ncbi:uncharacterized protein DS421_14g473760 [Arachis hypogaea]|nr:uncharacterized protein DS421_14g473760 [Arachis hypogaea]